MNRAVHLLITYSLIACLLLCTGAAFAGKEHHHATDSPDADIRNKALLSKIWWNQSAKIQKTSLTDDQRHEMDHIFTVYLNQHATHIKEQKEAFKGLGAALSSGDKALAEQQRDKLSQLTSESVQQQIDAMIEVTNELSEEQRTLIAAEYPALMSRLWLISANPAARQLGRKERKIRR